MCTLNNLGPASWIACTTSVPARTVCPTSMQHPMRGSIPLTAFNTSSGECHNFILRTVIVNRDADGVLLYELLDSRQSFRRGIAGDNDRNTRSLAVFEFGSDVRIFIFREVEGAGGVKLDARRSVVRERGWSYGMCSSRGPSELVAFRGMRVVLEPALRSSVKPRTLRRSARRSE
jgi:hypothetical protein